MDLSRHSPAPTRYVGIGLVVALHLAGIYALSAGMIKAPPRMQEPLRFKPLAPDQPLPPPPETFKAPELPKAGPPQVIQVPVPDFVVEPATESTAPATQPLRTEATSQLPAGPARPDTPPLQGSLPLISAPGAVCTVMPRPEVPVVSWTGEAVLQVVATVRGGRVVGSDVRVTQGAVDGKMRRTLQRSVESALAGYQCQGDAVFQQDFAFRLD